MEREEVEEVVECITNPKEEERKKRVRVETATSQKEISCVVYTRRFLPG
jgi:hypothetical protein